MKSDLPKVLHPLCGKPLILYVIESLRNSGINDIITVVGYKGKMVIETLGNSVEYVWQHDQLGTGHAVMQVESSLNDYHGPIVLACGDVPLIKPSTFKRLQEEFQKDGIMATVLTMIMDNPRGYGRIITDERGNVNKIIEERDANLEEKRIKEVNSGTYAFDKDLLFAGLKTINTDNAQGEYYLPDVFDYIKSSGYSIGRILLNDFMEGSGINSQEELSSLGNYLKMA